MGIEISEWHWRRTGRGKGVCSRVSFVAECRSTLSTRDRKEGNPDMYVLRCPPILSIAHDAWEIPTALPRRGNPPRWVSHGSVGWVLFANER